MNHRDPLPAAATVPYYATQGSETTLFEHAFAQRLPIGGQTAAQGVGTQTVDEDDLLKLLARRRAKQGVAGKIRQTKPSNRDGLQLALGI